MTLVVGEDHHPGSPIEADLVDDVLRPSDQDSRRGEALWRGKGAPGVDHRHPVPHLAGEAGQRLTDVNRADDEHLLGRRQRLDEHFMGRVLHGTVLLVVHQHQGVCGQIRRDVGRQGAGHGLPGRVEDDFGTEVRPVDEGDHRPVLLAIEYALNRLERAHHGSMKTSMVPPQAMPTSKASSSAIP